VIFKNTQKFPEEVSKVLEVLNSQDMDHQVRVFDAPAHHAREAAELLNCPLGAVVKSLVFASKDQEKFVLVLVSGQNRADNQKLSKITGFGVLTAKPERVLALTGYPVGAVPPFGADLELPVIIDQDLMTYQNLWASAGSSHILVNFESVILKK
jgi:prolyl-tRNA editing enzyme YbaK/EbsC (Cys-tRNA(Pro) deacylase)